MPITLNPKFEAVPRGNRAKTVLALATHGFGFELLLYYVAREYEAIVDYAAADAIVDALVKSPGAIWPAINVSGKNALRAISTARQDLYRWQREKTYRASLPGFRRIEDDEYLDLQEEMFTRVVATTDPSWYEDVMEYVTKGVSLKDWNRAGSGSLREKPLAQKALDHLAGVRLHID